MSGVLITGANGFLGRRVAHAFRSRNDVQLRLSGRQPETENSSDDYVCFDICHAQLPSKLLDNISIVVHAAGLAHCFDKTARPDYESVNVTGTLRLAKAALAAEVQHFVYISSVSVYGPTDSSQSPVRNESSGLNPITEYGQSKQRAECQLVKLLQGSSTKLTILRPATIYGASEPGNIRRLIRFLSRVPFWVTIGSGANKKSLIHVDDAAEMIATAALEYQDNTGSQVFNVADIPRSMKEITDTVCSVVGTLSLPLSLPTTPIKVIGGSRLKRLLEKWEVDDAYDGQELQGRTAIRTFLPLPLGVDEQYRDLRRRGELQTGALAKRCFDLAASLVLLGVFSIPMLIIGALVKLTSSGPALYSSQRVGADNKLFPMLKFRSMRKDAPQVATHLLTDSQSLITPVGRILRKTSLDELPQLLNVLFGKMSLVGPRPALFNQHDLISLRESRGIKWLKPGITGLAQVCGRDDLAIPEKVELDVEYSDRRGVFFDLKLIFKTVLKVVTSDNISQADVAGDDSQPRATIRHGNSDTLFIDSSFSTAAGILADKYRRCCGSRNKDLSVISVRRWCYSVLEEASDKNGDVYFASNQHAVHALLQERGCSSFALPSDSPLDLCESELIADQLGTWIRR